MRKLIEIPCESYLKKFLIHTYGSEPIKASKWDPLCLILYKSLQSVPYDYKPVRRNFDDSITFELFSDNNIERRKLYLNESSVISAQAIIKNAFYDSLRKYVLYDNKDIDNSSAINKFLRLYSLNEDDIKKESLVKCVYRFKVGKSAKLQKFMLVLSENCH